MISESEVLQLLIDTYPPSREAFVKRASEWVPKKGANGVISAHCLLTILTNVVVDDFMSGGYEKSQELFQLIERFVCEGDDIVREAACTNFIENLQNIASHNKGFEYQHFVDLLGKESRNYAKAWDKFTGVSTDEI